MAIITEWEANHALHIFFRHHQDFFLVFQDPDFHAYVDRILAHNTVMGKNKPRKIVQTIRGRFISADPQQIRTDAILLDKSGRSHILETKVKLSSQADHLEVVIQTLCYADLLMTPRWLPEWRTPQNKPPSTTYDLLEDLHEAHWHMKVFAESAKYQSLRERHHNHFYLPKNLEIKDFEQIPNVFFLLDEFDANRLKDATLRVGELDYQEFRQYAASVLKSRDAYVKRLRYLKDNWLSLQKVKFGVMHIDTKSLSNIIDTKVKYL